MTTEDQILRQSSLDIVYSSLIIILTCTTIHLFIFIFMSWDEVFDCLVGCKNILRFMLVFSVRNIIAQPLPRTKTASSLKNSQQIIVVKSQTIKLVLHRRDLVTIKFRIVAQDTSFRSYSSYVYASCARSTRSARWSCPVAVKSRRRLPSWSTSSCK